MYLLSRIDSRRTTSLVDFIHSPAELIVAVVGSVIAETLAFPFKPIRLLDDQPTIYAFHNQRYLFVEVQHIEGMCKHASCEAPGLW